MFRFLLLFKNNHQQNVKGSRGQEEEEEEEVGVNKRQAGMPNN